MRMIRKPFTLFHTLFLFFCWQFSGAQPAVSQPFELRSGDRVVFVGNSIFEDDQEFGYLELALTTRWPDRDITFRNLGWSGDNVFGEARSYITNPPSAYELLIQQIKDAQPTVLIFGYGAIESQEGEAGLPRFNDGYKKLLEQVAGLNARVVLLSPIPSFSEANVDISEPRNLALQLYGSAVGRLANERGARFIDVFNPLAAASKISRLSDNGVHLNEAGYYYLALALEKGFGLPDRGQEVTLSVSKKGGVTATEPVKIASQSLESGGFEFEWKEQMLPLVIPTSLKSEATPGRILKISGLKKGFYTLLADGFQLMTASSDEWNKGVRIDHGASYTQSEYLRGYINKKNGVYFQKYRPPNRTYILGFRSYEQGKHKQGLEDLNILITWMEAQISIQRIPRPQVYQLILTK